MSCSQIRINTGITYRLIFKAGIQPHRHSVKLYFIKISGLLIASIRSMFFLLNKTGNIPSNTRKTDVT
jgi:hypothetical protein